MRALCFVAGGLIALLMLSLKLTCRVRWYNDPRPGLRDQGQVYAYALLHSHLGAGILFGEVGSGTMVSRSIDGDLVIPSLRARGIVPVRGSSRRDGEEKGGRAALEALIEYVRGGRPALLTVDGPRGPRNHVQPGIAHLAREAQAAIVTLIPIPTRRWVFRSTWDRLQIPKPFSRTDVYFGEPLRCRADESGEAFRLRLEKAIAALEREHDPIEAAPKGAQKVTTDS